MKFPSKEQLLYLGVLKEEWNLLLSEVEELLAEEEIGTHILGVYPFGERLYGNESSAPGILCIYFDDPAKLLNPIEDNPTAKKLSIGRGAGPVYFISLYDWVRIFCDYSINKIGNSNFYKNYCDLIPTMLTPWYEDPQLTILMDLARDFMQVSHQGLGFYSPSSSLNLNLFTQYAFLRSRLVLYHTGIFAPCLNKKWQTEILEIEESWFASLALKESERKETFARIKEHDNKIISYYNQEEQNLSYPTSKNIDSLHLFRFECVLHTLGTELYSISNINSFKKERDLLGEATCNIYRSLL